MEAEKKYSKQVEDYEHILEHTVNLWGSMRNKRIFLTGGTGFFGRWLLESFAYVNDKLGLNAKVVVLSRDPEAFLAKVPSIAQAEAITFHKGDVTCFKFPEGKFDFMIHAATEASAKVTEEDPVGMINTIVKGTSRALEFAKYAEVKRFLLTSSGAIYGKQPWDLPNVSEEFSGAPNPCCPGSAYSEAKRLAELLCAAYYKQYKIECIIARCFAFVGPYLPLDTHFAVGNFISNALKGESIHISGDGTPYRSYMYASDLMVWLWTLLCKGQPGRAYNVGADRPVSIKELADLVAKISEPQLKVTVARDPIPGSKPLRYVPDIRRAKEELGLQIYVSLEDSLQRTIRYYQEEEACES